MLVSLFLCRLGLKVASSIRAPGTLLLAPIPLQRLLVVRCRHSKEDGLIGLQSFSCFLFARDGATICKKDQRLDSATSSQVVQQLRSGRRINERLTLRSLGVVSTVSAPIFRRLTNHVKPANDAVRGNSCNSGS